MQPAQPRRLPLLLFRPELSLRPSSNKNQTQLRGQDGSVAACVMRKVRRESRRRRSVSKPRMANLIGITSRVTRVLLALGPFEAHSAAACYMLLSKPIRGLARVGQHIEVLCGSSRTSGWRTVLVVRNDAATRRSIIKWSDGELFTLYPDVPKQK